MSSKNSRSLRSKKEELGSHSRHDKRKIPMETQLHTYTDHYGVTWHGKKRDFVNTPINSYDSLGSIGHIIIGVAKKVTTTSDTLEDFMKNHCGLDYMRNDMNWKCIVDGTGYECQKHVSLSYLEQTLR